MEAQVEIINIMWEGPLTFQEAYEMNDWGKYGSLLPEVSGYRFTNWLWGRRSYEPMGQ